MKELIVPITEKDIESLRVGDTVLISGRIYCGRDAVLPKICELIRENKLKDTDIDLRGSVIFHTAVSVAGVGPTSSNKLEIEGSFSELSHAGVKMHLGKGAIGKNTVEELGKRNAVYAIMPPVTALLMKNIVKKRVVAFSELGMEAFYELEVKQYPAIIAAAHNATIY